MGYRSSDTPEGKHKCCCHIVTPIAIPKREPKLMSLTASADGVRALYDNGFNHRCAIVPDGDMVHIGCVSVSVRAIKLIRAALAKELRFQRANVKRLMGELRQSDAKSKAARKRHISKPERMSARK